MFDVDIVREKVAEGRREGVVESERERVSVRAIERERERGRERARERDRQRDLPELLRLVVRRGRGNELAAACHRVEKLPPTVPLFYFWAVRASVRVCVRVRKRRGG